MRLAANNLSEVLHIETIGDESLDTARKVEAPVLIVAFLLGERHPVLGQLTLARENEGPEASIHLGADGDTTSSRSTPSDESDTRAKGRVVAVFVHLTDIVDLDALEEGEAVNVTGAKHDDVSLD